MTDPAIRVVPAGWYEDPADPSRVRWWNGVGWTEHTEPKPGAEPTPARVDVGFEAATTTEAATTPAFAATSAAAGQPLTRRQAIASEGARPVAAGPRSTTGAVWFAALIPVIALALAIGGLYLFFYAVRSPLIALIALVPYVLGLLLALSDSRRLAARGFRGPSPFWALLTPLGYLIVRRTRVPGTGPLLLFVVTAVLAIGLPAAFWTSGAAGTVTVALDVQETAVSRLVDSGRLQSVSCPPFIGSTAPGSLFTCQATSSDGLPTEVWVSIDSVDGAFSLAPAL